MLEVRLRHDFGGFAVDAAFVAPAGVTALYGRSGSGKTTIVNAVAGLLKPRSGRILADGETLLDTGAGIFVPAHKRRVGYVFQEARLFPHLDVRANLLYGARFAPSAASGPGLDQIANLLGIGHLLGRRPGPLSGGEKQRVALGRAILARPRILLMDEPLAALDDERKAEILPYLERLRDEIGVPILYVSHSVAEIARLATTVVALSAGRVLAAGPVGEVLSDAGAAAGLGPREAGAVLSAVVGGHEADGLSLLRVAAGELLVPRVAAVPGTVLRLRILASDVMLATRRPDHISALNVLPAIVREIRAGQGPGAMVRLDAGGEALLARVTQRSVAALGLEPGMPVFAVLKAVSVARENVGG